MGQAAGMGEASALGLVLQRSVLLSCLTALLPILAWARAPQLLRLLGQQVRRRGWEGAAGDGMVAATAPCAPALGLLSQTHPHPPPLPPHTPPR
jgi:Na+-driven multidrug efflux pump